MKYYDTPEVIARVRTVNTDAEDRTLGDRIVGIQVQMDAGRSREGTVQIDVRDLDPKKRDNLILEISLPDLMAALASATLNREDNSK